MFPSVVVISKTMNLVLYSIMMLNPEEIALLSDLKWPCWIINPHFYIRTRSIFISLSLTFPSIPLLLLREVSQACFCRGGPRRTYHTVHKQRESLLVMTSSAQSYFPLLKLKDVSHC